MNKKQATIILVRGIPGSGKSYFATELQKVLGEKSVMLDPDATDYSSEAYLRHVDALTAEGVDSMLHAYRFLRAQAYKAIQDGGIAIWNQPFTNLDIFKKMTANFEREAAEYAMPLKIMIVEVEIDDALAKSRIDERKHAGGHGPSDATFNRFMNDYESFDQLGYKTVKINGSDDIQTSLKAVLTVLSTL